MGWAEFVLAAILIVSVTLAAVMYPVRREYQRLIADAEHWQRLAAQLAAERGVTLIDRHEEESTP